MTRLRRGSPGLIRDLNRSAVLAVIGQHGPIARAEIARRSSLSAATVTEVTRALIDEGLVQVVEQAASSGGRPPLLLGIVPRAGLALGAKISPDRLALVTVDLDGEVVAQSDEPFDTAAPDAIDRLASRLARAVRRAGSTRLLGIGLGIPGMVDAQHGTVASPIIGWPETALGPLLQERLGLPVLVDNDVNTLAVAERLYDRGRDVEHFLTVTIGRGVGLGIVVGGDLYRGARGGAGELGHVPVVEGGPRCECGMDGCLEALVADPALVGQAVAAGLLPAGTDSATGRRRLRALADEGDPTARDIYARSGATLGRAVGGLVNVLSPQLVIIGGEGADAWEHLRESFDAALDASTFPPLRPVRVAVEPWDDVRWARGAAALVLRATFAAPLYEREAEDAVRQRLAAAR